MGQGALSKPAVQWWLSLNSSKKVTFGVRLKSTRPSEIRSFPHESCVTHTTKFLRFLGCQPDSGVASQTQTPLGVSYRARQNGGHVAYGMANAFGARPTTPRSG